MPLVFEDIDLPGGGGLKCAVEVVLWGSGQPIAGKVASTNKTIDGIARPFVDDAGQWSLDLVGNSDILPSGTTYRVLRDCAGCSISISYVSVPVTGGPFEITDIEVDAMSSIAPSFLSVHAADLSLHGGGIDLDYAEITAGVTVTGTAAGAGSAAPIPGLTIDVPDLARPVRIWAKAALAQAASDAPTTGIFGIFHTGLYTAFDTLEYTELEGLNTSETPTPAMFLALRLPAHSGGSYTLAAHCNSGNRTVRVVANAFRKACIWASAS